MYKSRAILIGIIFLVNNLFGQADISSARLSKKMSVLNGRAVLMLPITAYELPRSTNGFDVAPNPNEETRIMYDTGKMRLVFYAQELYQLGDNDLLNEVNADSSYHKNFKNYTFTLPGKLLGIMSVPKKYDSTQRAILIRSLLVQTKDGTLLRVDAYINADAYGQIEPFKILADKILATLVNGTRNNVLNSRVEEYPLPDTTRSLRLLLPENYSVYVNKGLSSEGLKIIKFSYFRNQVRANMMIYIGGEPQYTYTNYGQFKQDARIDSLGYFLGQPTKWMTFNDPMHGIYFKEQGIPYTNPSLINTIHVTMLTNQPDMLFELSQVASEMELKKK